MERGIVIRLKNQRTLPIAGVAFAARSLPQIVHRTLTHRHHTALVASESPHDSLPLRGSPAGWPNCGLAKLTLLPPAVFPRLWRAIIQIVHRAPPGASAPRDAREFLKLTHWHHTASEPFGQRIRAVHTALTARCACALIGAIVRVVNRKWSGSAFPLLCNYVRSSPSRFTSRFGFARPRRRRANFPNRKS